MKLIVGLGNPEDKYSGTRHNLGFEVLEEYRKKHNLPDWSNEPKFKAGIVQTNTGIDAPFLREMVNETLNKEIIKPIQSKIILARPQTYMNKSGIAVAALASYYKIKPEDIIIIHDDLDLPLGHFRIRLGGAAAGHHGVESIIDSLKTDKFIRLRLGIGNLKTRSGEHKQTSFNVEHYVLEPFDQKEHSSVKRMIKHAREALQILLDQGLDKAQNLFN